MVKTMVKQGVPLKPMEAHRDAEIHLQPVEESHTGAGGCLRGGCDLVGGLWRGPAPMLEQPVLEGLHPVEVTHTAAV
ncbi:hypothetical protein HGM15179_019887 [Zosterops borbonicus]|uniref:Uncharacterized protein n=1 Tax=Zosterops borbonicus TaxID=364589 RepID=A0A8K1FYK5_9PASS|nr:hypothetical protein HGM15179_019887 [Zosterops borbonicus]